MAGKVLLINHGNALMANTLKRLLGEMEIETVQTEPVLESVTPLIKGKGALILFAGEFVFDTPDLLVYLKDICFGEDMPLCVAGSEQEIAEIRKIIPEKLISHAFPRPFDVKSIAGVLRELVSGGAGMGRGKHILMVDDDTLFLQAMQSWIGGRYQVTATKSGMQAITYLASHKPDLILLDYDMPVTSGPQVLEMIRSEQNSADIPVIFLTGRNDRDSVMSVMHLRPEGYLIKSQPREEIIASIDRFFETRKWENLYS
uniref:response regulator n=1 Tax=Eubacterium cellulosolvens TaxID=29322 RepID=UPI0004810BDB|nr:response regulator [[Eubacterium] cellulosolvens]